MKTKQKQKEHTDGDEAVPPRSQRTGDWERKTKSFLSNLSGSLQPGPAGKQLLWGVSLAARCQRPLLPGFRHVFRLCARGQKQESLRSLGSSRSQQVEL